MNADGSNPRRWTADVAEGEEKLESWIDALERGEVEEVVLVHQGRTATKLIAFDGRVEKLQERAKVD